MSKHLSKWFWSQSEIYSTKFWHFRGNDKIIIRKYRNIDTKFYFGILFFAIDVNVFTCWKLYVCVSLALCRKIERLFSSLVWHNSNEYTSKNGDVSMRCLFHLLIEVHSFCAEQQFFFFSSLYLNHITRFDLNQSHDIPSERLQTLCELNEWMRKLFGGFSLYIVFTIEMKFCFPTGKKSIFTTKMMIRISTTMIVCSWIDDSLLLCDSARLNVVLSSIEFKQEQNEQTKN